MTTEFTNDLNYSPRVVALAGGVGGAKLAAGLQAVLPPGALTVIVNTGDDFEHWGLNICPDIDTVMYNLAGIHNPEMGWGRRAEEFTVLDEISNQGGEDWFRLGDRDLAVHLRRSEWLRLGISLSEVTDRLRRSLGVRTQILPMSDSPVRTLVHTDEGDLPFQHYFVRLRCRPILVDLSFLGATEARLSERAMASLESADLIVLCPSNPYVSLDPILAVGDLRTRLQRSQVPVVAVSPIVAGQALKGPAAKMMRELGEMISPLTVVDHFMDFLDGFVMDRQDEGLAEAVGMSALVTDTVMTSDESKARLAQEVLSFGLELGHRIDQPQLVG